MSSRLQTTQIWRLALILVLVAPAAALADEAREWLEKMNRALAENSYEGTFFHERGGVSESLRIHHRVRDGEVAEHMGLSREEFEKLLVEANAVSLVSLNKKWCETDSSKDVHEIDILEDKKGEDPTRRIQKADLMRLVTKGLNRNERLIIILYYYEELTMKEIGATLDLSESRVSQMHSAIVERLQGQLGRRKPEFAM